MKNQALPRREEFITRDPNWSGYHEQIDAWNHFGRKTLDEAYGIFCESPEILQEDFMFMGPVAFRFYVPVLDRYIRSLAPTTLLDADPSMELLAACIEGHFGSREDMSGRHDVILALCDYVCAEITSHGEVPKRRERICASWDDLRKQVESSVRGNRRPCSGRTVRP